MAKYISQGVFTTERPVYIESRSSVVGKKEGEGPLGKCFDMVVGDSHFGMTTWEQAESRFQLEAVSRAVRKAGLMKEDIDVILAGDLINQCTVSSSGLRDLGIPFLGLFAACSTFAEGMLTAALLNESGAVKRSAVVTSSHFSTAERQFRTPLSYGGQRTPTAQWTCTASGAVILSDTGNVRIVGGCVGKITDMGITDMTNMGSAMAPAAAGTIRRYLCATETSPCDYDLILTGDLGIVGSKLLLELMQKQDIAINSQHRDCGKLIFDNETQDTHCGGSGCGCSASVLCGHFLPMLESGEVHDILFAATGALMSPASVQQGGTIPAIAHLVHLRKEKLC